MTDGRRRGASLPSAALLVAALAACGGEPNASIELADTRGVVAWLEAQRGRPVLVNFWATWCGPCLAEIPDLLAGTRGFRAADGVVLGVAMEQLGLDLTPGEAVARVQAKAAELELDFPVLVCTDDEMKTIRAILGVELGGLPQTLAYDRSGRLVAHHEGIASADEFAALAATASR